jgi:hypothetical protein
MAARIGSVEAVAHFLERGADKGVEDNDGLTPRQVARSRRFPEVADMIQQHRLPVNDRYYGDQHARLFTASLDEQEVTTDTPIETYRLD